MMQIVLNIVFVGLLIVASINDIRRMEIPDGLNLLILLLGIVKLTAENRGLTYAILDSLIGLVIVSIPLTMTAVVTKGAVGGGDIKLVGSCGFYMGSRAVLYGSAIGFVLGGLYAIVRLLIAEIRSKKNEFSCGKHSIKQELGACFALGPFLCAGMVVAMMPDLNTF